MNRVSVIIPTYGNPQLLVRTVESVLSQTVRPEEVLVVDDNGQGTEWQVQTYERVQRFFDIPSFRYIAHQSNMNGSAARNTGARASSGDYLVFLDGDDSMNPRFIETQLKVFDSCGADTGMVFCSSVDTFQGQPYAFHKAKSPTNSLVASLLHEVGSTSTWMIRRSAFSSIDGFDESFSRHQDYEFSVRLADKYGIEANPYCGIVKDWQVLDKPNREELMNKYLEMAKPYVGKCTEKDAKRILAHDYLSPRMKLIRQGRVASFCAECREGSIPSIVAACEVLRATRASIVQRTIGRSKAKKLLKSVAGGK